MLQELFNVWLKAFLNGNDIPAESLTDNPQLLEALQEVIAEAKYLKEEVKNPWPSERKKVLSAAG